MRCGSLRQVFLFQRFYEPSPDVLRLSPLSENCAYLKMIYGFGGRVFVNQAAGVEFTQWPPVFPFRSDYTLRSTAKVTIRGDLKR